MSELSKEEVNRRFYSAVGGEIVFETEAQGFLHPLAVAKLLAAHARTAGKRTLRVVELGANNCTFALSLLKMLTALAVGADVDLDSVDYFAVDFARSSLGAFFTSHADGQDFQTAIPGAAGAAL